MKGRFKSGVVSTFDAIYHDVAGQKELFYSYVMYLDDKNISVSLATMQLRSDNGGTKLVVTEQGAFLDGYGDAGSREHGTGYRLDSIGAWCGRDLPWLGRTVRLPTSTGERTG